MIPSDTRVSTRIFQDTVNFDDEDVESDEDKINTLWLSIYSLKDRLNSIPGEGAVATAVRFDLYVLFEYDNDGFFFFFEPTVVYEKDYLRRNRNIIFENNDLGILINPSDIENAARRYLNGCVQYTVACDLEYFNMPGWTTITQQEDF